jgi:hypothetical protein
VSRGRADLLAQLRALNDELRQRGGEPTYNVGAVDELFNDAELREAVSQTLHEVLALREWP